jgi:hypothetical protein
MRRLFTFGCSYTSFCWPTWADFVGQGFDEYYNYGQSGGGNQFILEQVTEADVTHKFNHNDTVIIMWSTYHRHDLYKNNEWITSGNVLNAKPLYDDVYLDKFFDVKGSVLHSLNYIHAAQQILEDRVTCHMSSMTDITTPLGESPGPFLKIFERYKNVSIFSEFPDLEKYSFIFDHPAWLIEPLGNFTVSNYKDDEFLNVKYSPESPPNRDAHPTPYMHLDWCKHVGLPIDDDKVSDLINSWERVWLQQDYIESYHGYHWCRNNIKYKRRQ